MKGGRGLSFTGIKKAFLYGGEVSRSSVFVLGWLGYKQQTDEQSWQRMKEGCRETLFHEQTLIPQRCCEEPGRPEALAGKPSRGFLVLK